MQSIICFSILATTFLELWKRKQAILVWEWDLQNTEEDVETRPEFETAEKHFRTNPVTKEREAYIPTISKVYRYCVTAGVVTMMVSACLSLSAFELTKKKQNKKRKRCKRWYLFLIHNFYRF